MRDISLKKKQKNCFLHQEKKSYTGSSTHVYQENFG